MNSADKRKTFQKTGKFPTSHENLSNTLKEIPIDKVALLIEFEKGYNKGHEEGYSFGYDEGYIAGTLYGDWNKEE